MCIFCFSDVDAKILLEKLTRVCSLEFNFLIHVCTSLKNQEWDIADYCFDILKTLLSSFFSFNFLLNTLIIPRSEKHIITSSIYLTP